MSICNLDHFAESYWEPRRHVLVGGCFDPLHEGHLAYFEEARKYGPLVCAVMPDRAMTKRERCLPEMTRLKVLNACALVEHVHLATADIAAVIRALKPLAYVVGKEHIGDVPSDDIAACTEVGTEITYVDCREQSSTALLADYERRRNAATLQSFEAWVQSQKPTEKPWEPVTDYSWEARRALEEPHARLICDVFQKPKGVLDVGCGPGHLVRALKGCGLRVKGVDLPTFDITWYDIADTDYWTFRADLVICREVLEHLTACQLAIAVRNLVELSSRYVYITTRFTAKSHLLEFDTADTLDPTHQTMLNQDLLRTLLVLEGARRCLDLERRLDWRGLGRVLVYEVGR